MDYSEAASHARKIQRSFDAFAKLEEVLRDATRAEAALADTLTRAEKLDGEAAELAQTVEALRKQAKKMQAEQVLREGQVKAEAHRAAVEREVFLAEQNAAREAVLDGMKREMVKDRAKADKARAVFEGAVEAEQAKVAAEEKKLAALQTMVGTLRNKIEGLL